MFETNDKIIILKKQHNESNLCYYTKYDYLLKQKLNKKNKYSNDDNKFNLNIYEQNLEKNLNQKITEEIFRYLNQIKL